MDSEEVLRLIELTHNYMETQTGKGLDPLEKVVLQGILENLSYQEICDRFNLGQNVDYIKQCLSYQLRSRLTKAFKNSGHLPPKANNLRKKDLPRYLLQIFSEENPPTVECNPQQSTLPADSPPEKSTPDSAPICYQNLPTRSHRVFFGYEEQMADLLDFLSPNNSVYRISIEGIGGVGKTTLILEAAYRCLPTNRFQAIVFTSAQPYRLGADRILRRLKRERTLSDIFRTISRVLERPDILGAEFDLQFELIQDLLADRSVLLIVDNLETLEDQEDVCSFLYELPATVKAVVTSREHTPLNFTIHLDSLPEEDAKQLIAHQAEEKELQISPEDCKKLYNKTGGIPGAIVYTIGQLAAGYFLADVLARLDSDKPEDLTRFCFESSVQPLRGKPAHRLLMAAAIFPKPALLEAISDVASVTNREHFAKLLQLSLVKKNDRNRYGMLPLTRGYILAELKAHPQFEEESRCRWVNWYRHFVEEYGGKDGKEWHDFGEIEAEWETLIEAIEWCIARDRYEDVLYFWRQVKSYSYSQGRQRDRFSYWTVPLDWQDWLIQNAERRQDWSTAVELMRDRAWKLVLKGQNRDLDAADALFARAWELRHDRELTTQLDLVICIAALRVEQEQFDNALHWLEEGKELLDKTTGMPAIAESNAPLAEQEATRFRVRLLYCEGEIYYKIGQYHSAKTTFTTVLELARSLSWQRAEFLSKDWLAHVAIEEGNFDEAECLLLECLAVAREKKDNCRIAFCQRAIAKLEFRRSNKTTAMRLAREALAIFLDLGMITEAQETQELLELVEAGFG